MQPNSARATLFLQVKIAVNALNRMLEIGRPAGVRVP